MIGWCCVRERASGSQREREPCDECSQILIWASLKTEQGNEVKSQRQDFDETLGGSVTTSLMAREGRLGGRTSLSLPRSPFSPLQAS